MHVGLKGNLTSTATHTVEVGLTRDHEALALGRVAQIIERCDIVAGRVLDVVLATTDRITWRARCADRVLHHDAVLLLVAGIGSGLASVAAVGAPATADLGAHVARVECGGHAQRRQAGAAAVERDEHARAAGRALGFARVAS